MGLLCPSCSFDNDPTRIFCHNCGLRLERGGYAPPPPTGFTTPAEIAEGKKQRRKIPWGQYFGALVRLLILGGLVAAAVFAFLPPDNVPPAVATNPELAKRLSALIEDSATANSVRSFMIPSSDAQVWFVSGVLLKESTGGVFTLRPERIYAVPGDNVIRVGLVTLLPMDLHLYFEGDYVPVREVSGYRLEGKRFSIGRLPLPPFAGMLVSRQLEGIAGAMSRPLGQLARASQIGVTPQTISLRWDGREP